MTLSEQDAQKALGHVLDPEIKKDLVSLNMIQNIKIQANTISFDLVLTTPACPLKIQIEDDCKKALTQAGFQNININTTAKIKAFVGVQDKKNIPGVKNIIAISSGKGGVGKSTVSLNLALALASTGAKVGLIDADITAPNLHYMLGLKDITVGLTEDGKHILPIETHGIKLISMGMFAKSNQPITWRGPMLSKALQQLCYEVLWEELDYLFLDMPPGTGDAQITITQSLPLAGAVIISTPQGISVLDAQKGLLMFQNANVPVLGLIENMSYFVAPDTGNTYHIFGEKKTEALAKLLKVDYLGELTINLDISKANDDGKQIVRKEFLHLAQKIAAKLSLDNHYQHIN